MQLTKFLFHLKYLTSQDIKHFEFLNCSFETRGRHKLQDLSPSASAMVSKRRRGKRVIQNFEYLQNESFPDKIKSIFYNF